MILEYLAGEGGIALLDVNPGLLIWTTFTFLVVMLLLRVFAWKPIAKALDERAEKIHADLDRADAIRREAEARLEEYMGKLNGLRAEGQEILTEARKDAETLKEELLAEARKDAEAVRARGLRDIQLAVDKALEQYHETLTEMSVSVAGQILGRTLQPADHQDLIGKAVAQIRTLGGRS